MKNASGSRDQRGDGGQLGSARTFAQPSTESVHPMVERRKVSSQRMALFQVAFERQHHEGHDIRQTSAPMPTPRTKVDAPGNILRSG